MKPTVTSQQTPDGHLVTISGNLSVKNAKLFKALLEKILGKVDQIKVEMPSEIDLSALQIIRAFERKQRTEGVKVTTVFNLQERDRVLLLRTGFEELFKS